MVATPEIPGVVAITLAVVLGIGLSAAAGFRVFVPLLIAALAVRLDFLRPPEALSWIGSWTAIILLGVACMAEILASLIPAVDHVMDGLAAPFAAAAGAILMAISMATELGLTLPDSVGAIEGVGEVQRMSPLLFWSLAIIVGGGAGLGTHAALAAGRATSTVTTAGMANPIYSALESVAAIGGSGLAVLAPACCAVVAVPFIIIALVVLLRAIRRKGGAAVVQGPA